MAEITDALRNGTPIPDARLEALAQFTGRPVETLPDPPMTIRRH